MATEALPGLNADESYRLQSQAEQGLQFDDEMRGYVGRIINALQSPPPAPRRRTKKKR